MHSRIQAIAIPSELGDFSDEVRAVFLELGRLFGSESLAGECSPALDVHETDDRLEITVDLPVHRTEDLKTTQRFRELETLVLQKIRHAAKGGNIRITT